MKHQCRVSETGGSPDFCKRRSLSSTSGRKETGDREPMEIVRNCF